MRRASSAFISSVSSISPRRLIRRALCLLCRSTPVVVMLLLAACASTRPSTLSAVRYDLGSPAVLSASPAEHASAAATTGMAPPAIKVLDVRASPGLDSDQIRYRLMYEDPAVAHDYAHSRWTSTPAQLFTQSLRQRLGMHEKVLDGGDPVRAPILKLELEEFAQLFDRPGVSRGVVAVRATLIDAGTVLAQRNFVVGTPAPSADAGGGVRALADSTDNAIDQIAAWIAAQPLPADAPTSLPPSPSSAAR